MNGASLLVAALENEGVERIFGVPGEENLDLLESLHRSSIDLVVMRHEQTAAFMAATYGRLTGKPGVALSTLGPGALNLATGAAYAHLGGMPLVLITGQKPIRHSRQAQFQIVDVIASMRPLTKYTRQIVSAASIPTLVREAFRTAVEERPGPVHLELPEDVAAEPVTDVPLVPVHPVEHPEPPRIAIDRAARAILAAKHPVLMFGAGASRSYLAPALSDFVRRTCLPFFNTQMGKGSVSGCSDLYLGTAALTERDHVHRAIDRADLIVTIGHETVEKPPFVMSHGEKSVVHIGYTPATIEEIYSPQVEVTGDITAALLSLAELLEGRLAPSSDLLALRASILARVAEGGDDDRFPLTPQRIVRDVRRVMPPDGIVALDNALATMGAGLASAMMAALLHPERRVLAVCGDGGFMMNSQELETALRLKLNLVVLIVEDGAYGMIRWKQSIDGLADWGLKFNNPDFPAYARAYGANGRQIRSADELVPALEEAFSAGGVHLISAPIDYSENIRLRVDED